VFHLGLHRDHLIQRRTHTPPSPCGHTQQRDTQRGTLHIMLPRKEEYYILCCHTKRNITYYAVTQRGILHIMLSHKEEYYILCCHTKRNITYYAVTQRGILHIMLSHKEEYYILSCRMVESRMIHTIEKPRPLHSTLSPIPLKPFLPVPSPLFLMGSPKALLISLAAAVACVATWSSIHIKSSGALPLSLISPPLILSLFLKLDSKISSVTFLSKSSSTVLFLVPVEVSPGILLDAELSPYLPLNGS
jgi:hypothetical protein